VVGPPRRPARTCEKNDKRRAGLCGLRQPFPIKVPEFFPESFHSDVLWSVGAEDVSGAFGAQLAKRAKVCGPIPRPAENGRV
jgi:hypothetical protein